MAEDFVTLKIRIIHIFVNARKAECKITKMQCMVSDYTLVSHLLHFSIITFMIIENRAL